MAQLLVVLVHLPKLTHPLSAFGSAVRKQFRERFIKRS